MVQHKRRLRILVSPVGGQAMYGILHYLKENGFEIFGIDCQEDIAGKFFVDFFKKVPKIDDDRYKSSVLDLICDNEIDIFMSWLDNEILFWNTEFYKNGIPEEIVNIFTFNFREDLLDFCDKYAFSTILNRNNLPTPITVSLKDFIDKRGYNIPFPFIIKPRLGSGSRMVNVIRDKLDFECIMNFLDKEGFKKEDFIIQELIEGSEYTVDFFSNMGELVNICVRKRLKHKGISIAGEVVYKEKIEELVGKFCSIFKIDGLNNIQIIESETSLYITDFNPRPSGTIILSIKAGIDLINNLIEKWKGEKITKYGKPKKLKMFRYYAEFYHE